MAHKTVRLESADDIPKTISVLNNWLEELKEAELSGEVVFPLEVAIVYWRNMPRRTKENYGG